jgi:nitrate/TMAO reductase-like tetraheme cytochrome c subunit
VPLTYKDGPHGLHTVGSTWVSAHQNYANNATNRQTCTTCHGADYRGSVLSKTSAARSFNADGKTVRYTAGQQVTCYDCHNGPNGD